MVKQENFLGLREIFFDFIFPTFCLSCGGAGKYVCKRCCASLTKAEQRCVVCSRKNPLGLTCRSCLNSREPTLALAVFAYCGSAKSLIRQFKYDDVTELKYFFADELARLAKTISDYKDFVVQAVPISSGKKRRRGYNQSEIVGELVAKKLKVPFTDSLARVEAPKTQVKSGGKTARKLNVKGCFSAKQSAPPNIILIDDVVTTGSTMREAAKALFRAGAKQIVCLSIAR